MFNSVARSEPIWQGVEPVAIKQGIRSKDFKVYHDHVMIEELGSGNRLAATQTHSTLASAATFMRIDPQCQFVAI